MEFKPSVVVTDLKFTHFYQLVVARAKKIPVVITPETRRIIPNPQNNVVIITGTTRYRSHS